MTRDLPVSGLVCQLCGRAGHDEWAHWCDHCGQKDDACTCWMLDPVYTGAARP